MKYTVEQSDNNSCIELNSTNNGKIFEFVIQSLNGPKQIEFVEKQ